MLPADIIRTACERGIRRIAFTDHFYTFTNPSQFESLRTEVREVLSAIADPPIVYFACEAEVMAPGRTAGSHELADRLDFVMVGATHFQNVGITDLPKAKDDLSIARHYVRMFEYAVSLPWVDVMAHPFFVVPEVCSADILKLITDSDLEQGIETAAQNSVAMEISRRALGSPEQLAFSTRFLRLCKEAGIKFTLGSDAHTLRDVGNVHILRWLIEELDLEESDFWFPQCR